MLLRDRLTFLSDNQSCCPWCCSEQQLLSLTLNTKPTDLLCKQYITSGQHYNVQQTQLKQMKNEQLHILTDECNEKHTLLSEKDLFSSLQCVDLLPETTWERSWVTYWYWASVTAVTSCIIDVISTWKTRRLIFPSVNTGVDQQGWD